MIKVHFIKKDKKDFVEQTNKTEILLWEARDGYHAFPVQSVFKDEQGIYPPITIYFADIVSPVGATDASKTINEQITILNLIREGGGRIPVSSQVGRALAFFFKYLMYFMVIGIIIYGLLSGMGVTNGP